ncbi:MAG TPA: adenylyl-sulfate kinase [Kofleriaceae bacterium]|nr:adenylyl-sulfate kinase [Kofleriaceae bacterium]
MAAMTGVVAWLTGLPSSGKTTLARAIAAELDHHGEHAVVLDSDELRAAFDPPLGYDDDSRVHLYLTLARLAASIARQGHIVLVPATAHRRAFRDAARAIAPAFVEIFVDTPLDECRRRDTKGLYAANAPRAPGAGVAYEPPLAPDHVVQPGDHAAPATIAHALVHLLHRA